MSVRDEIATLLPKFSLPGRAREKIDAFISQLERKLTTALEAQATPQPLTSETVLEKVKLPLADRSIRLEASFLFRPPTAVTAVGSYALGCIAREAVKVAEEEQQQQQQHHRFVVDLAVEIPKGCWQKRDQLNYVYHRKRAFYLAYLANKLQKWVVVGRGDSINCSSTLQLGSVHFAFHQGDHMKPMVVLTPADRKLAALVRFHLLAYAPTEKKSSFAYSRLGPERCNIQAALFDATLQQQDTTSSSPAPTPHYNASILQDCTMASACQQLSSILAGKSNLLEALVLLRVWLEARDLRRPFAHVLTAYSCYLLRKGRLNPSAPPFALFKAILQQLITSGASWASEGVAFNFNDEEEDSFDEATVVARFRVHDQANDNFQPTIVLVDGGGGSLHNLTANLSLDLYERLLYDARLLSERLQRKTIVLGADVAAIFSPEPVAFDRFFDHYLKVSTDVLVKGGNNSILSNSALFLETGFNAVAMLVAKVMRLLRQAVGDRLSLMQVRPFSVDACWPVTACPPYKSTVQFITVGLLVGKAFQSPLIKGPPADDSQAAKAFRAFWGERAEIRRFANGDICEAVLWPTTSNTAQESRKITLEMISWTLNRLLPIRLKQLSTSVGHLDRLLELPSLQLVREGVGGNSKDGKDAAAAVVHYGTGEHFLALANGGMVALKRHLHSLNALNALTSFSVVDVSGVDPVLRSTEVFPPLPLRAKPATRKMAKTGSFCNLFDLEGEENSIDKLRYIKPVEVLVKVEANPSSSNENSKTPHLSLHPLPADLTALANLRYLVHYELGKALAVQQKNDLLVRPTAHHLDVLLGGHLFRLRAVLPREVALLRSLANRERAVKSVECPAADELEFTASVLPPLSASLRAMGAEAPAFSLTCRLFKRWLAAAVQLGHYWRPITADLLVAAAFSSSDSKFALGGYPVPGSPEAGLLRVLHFLAEHDFARSPVVVDFGVNGSGESGESGGEPVSTTTTIETLVASFAAERHRLPPLTIVTPYERSKLSVHSRRQPSAPVLHHTVKLARVAAKRITDQLSSASGERFRAEEVTSYLLSGKLSDQPPFDLLIHLKSRAVPRKAQALDFPAHITIRQTLYDGEAAENGDKSGSSLKTAMPIVDWDPVARYLDSLKAAFDNQALFFVDEYGGRTIGVLLRPEALEVRPFRLATLAATSAAMLTGTAYSSAADNVALNLPALIEDLTVMGEGLVERVVLGERQKQQTK